MNSEIKDVKFVYVPNSVLDSADIFDEIFQALEIPQTPQLMFQINRGRDVKEWNYKTPAHQSFLRLTPEEYAKCDDAKKIIQREHYEGVIRENCKRMLHGISLACEQAHACFKLYPTWNPKIDNDYIADWLSNSGHTTPRLGILGSEQLDTSILNALLMFAKNTTEADEGLETVAIDSNDWLANKDNIRVETSKRGKELATIPHPKATHIIICEDVHLFEEKIAVSGVHPSFA